MLTYKSNAGSVVLRITEKLKATQVDMDILVREVANGFYTENQRRVNNEGKDVKGALIGKGKYSTKPSLATKNQFTKKSEFHPTVLASGVSYSSSVKTKKVKAKKFEQGDRWLWIKFKKAKKAVPVMLLEDGYKQLRQIQGKPVDHVNLQYTGTLKTKFIIQNQNNKYLIGFDGDYGKKVSGYLEDKYNQKIWGISKEGEQLAKDITIRFIKDHLK